MQLEFKKKGPTRDMLYFKNSELAYTYHVSVKTVSNWIESTKQGKLDLTLTEHNGRSYVTNSARNIAIIEELVEKGKKYRPHRALKVVSPKPEFYRLYNEAQIYDIVSNLEIHHEIPVDYNYFAEGAKHWDEYATRLLESDQSNSLSRVRKMLEINSGYLDDFLSKYTRINIVDIGVGNAIPVQGLLQHLIDQKKFGRYIAVDISRSMLDIARKNINAWFGNKVKFEGLELDINHERFANVLAEEYIHSKNDEVGNLIICFGGTIQNLRNPNNALRVIHDSMGINDFFLYDEKLDTATSRRYFDFNQEASGSSLASNYRFIFDLLNIDESFYDVEVGFDAEKRERFIKVRLKIAVTLEFDFEMGRRKLELAKGDAILLLRIRHRSPEELLSQLKSNDFYVLQTSQTADREYLLAVSQIKRD